MGDGDLLLTAQHQDDQAETLLLQLLRGSGPGGLAAMPRLNRFGPGWLARPLLEFSRTELEVHARALGLNWVEDPSNRDLRFDRNYLRHRVMPLLRQRWPAAAATIARSARLSGELQELVDEQAAQDLIDSQGTFPGTLSITSMRMLSSARVRSLLRHWVKRRGGSMPGYRQLRRIEQECLAGRRDARPLVHWAEMEVRRFRDDLFLLKSMPPHDAAVVIPWSGLQPLCLPAGLGKLVLEPAEAGLSRSLWLQTRVEVRFRLGGERCVPLGLTQHRSLKKLFQEWAIPPWQRDRIPLIYLDGRLAVIPGRMICEPFAAEPGVPAVSPRWSVDQP
jgi:tRNA(Ile)-lysidine synthase